MIKTRIGALMCAFTLALPVGAHAQAAFPSQPIRLVVPFTPGTTTDITARAIAQRISGPLGQPVIVENRPGAAGQIGMQAVAAAKPDGHTLVVGSVSSTVMPSILYKSPPFNLLRDFTPVTTLANTSLVLTVSSESPFHSVADLVAAAKRSPRTLTYGNAAGLFQLAMEALNQDAGIDLLGVPYKGVSEATNDMLGGRLTVTPNSLGAATGMLQAGRTRALAVLSLQRDPSLPNVPTMVEEGYKDFVFDGLIGVLAPAGTPAAIVQRLQQEIARAVDSDEIREQFRKLYLDARALTPQDYVAALKRDLARYTRIAEEAKMEKQ